MGSKHSADLSRQRAKKNGRRIGTDGAYDLDEFNDIDASFPALVFGDERLRLAKPIRQLL
jgi:hypothetical protein